MCKIAYFKIICFVSILSIASLENKSDDNYLLTYLYNFGILPKTLNIINITINSIILIFKIKKKINFK